MMISRNTAYLQGLDKKYCQYKILTMYCHRVLTILDDYISKNVEHNFNKKKTNEVQKKKVKLIEVQKKNEKKNLNRLKFGKNEK